ncbi:MAG TPA: alpha/beta hydrolase [Rhizomicrobium sp.]|jgi:pimeloyl-ACP methyl ester carboxylesterase|nr:alpha/beta hydrolase [Rhizomicrobium sp.]
MGEVGLGEPYATLTLKDGRKLSYLEVGPPSGAAVFHFHGHGSSRLEALMLEDAANTLGLRVLAFDRPGIGFSDPKDGDRLLGWPDDMAEAADLLGIARFAVQGMSAGGPYALACAHKLAPRIAACSLVSAVPPPEISRRAGPRARRLAWWIAARFPNYLRRRLQQFRPDGVPQEEMVRSRMLRVAHWLGGEDERLMQVAALRNVLARTMMETARQGGAGNRSEIERLVRPWGFDIAAIAVPRMFVWHGDEDRIMPVGPARLMARVLADCTATFYRREGHFSILVNRPHDLLGALRPAAD